MFHTLIILTIVLTFSAPFSALAQQNRTQTTAEIDAGLLAAKAAEQDAGRDINKLLWFGAGIAICCIGGTIGGLTGALVGNLIDPVKVEESTGLGFAPYFVPDTSGGGALAIGTGVGLVAGVLVPFIGISRYQSNPPAERLLGKSPEYVESYTNAYKVKARSLRTSMAVAGAATVGGGLGLCLFGSLQ